MNYRSEIAELAKYFNSLNSIYKKYYFDYSNVLRVKRFDEFKSMLEQIFSELFSKYRYLALKIVELMMISINMVPSGLYIVVQGSVMGFSYGIGYGIIAGKSDALRFFTALKIQSALLTYETDVAAKEELIITIMLVLNHETIRSLLRPEDYALLDKIWELYFGDVE